ncbi:MAG: 4'-phosphopantetheinyl transferase superfamily protein [Proteobacteria bacterium]|nr:4'-phosphopantetheinyl transferase superfamily protein [Pseudomonadota bacterium]
MSVDEMPGHGNHRVRALPSPVPAIALWWCALDASAGERAEDAALLADAEHARAARFGRPELRDRYVTGRALLRRLLGAALGCPPAAVPIVRGTRGRPRIDAPGAPDFNVTHTRERSLVAIGLGARLGVDLEHRERPADSTRLARKFLSSDEQRALHAYAPALRHERFLRWWTCKEAMSKATGDGLAAPFGALTVELEPRFALRDGPAPYVPDAWQLWPVAVPDDYLGTLALWLDATPPAA